MMKPCSLLQHEHRLVERIIDLMREEIQCIRQTERVDVNFIDTAADFIGSYMGQIHHGKEDMLFHALSKKKISDEDFLVMAELVQDHQTGKKIIGNLLKAKDSYAKGDGSLSAIAGELEAFVTFYPQHMRREENAFFPRVEGYFNEEELQTLLREFRSFNAALVRKNVNSVKEQKQKNAAAKLNQETA